MPILLSDDPSIPALTTGLAYSEVYFFRARGYCLGMWEPWMQIICVKPIDTIPMTTPSAKILDVRIDVRRHHPSTLNGFNDHKNYEALQSSRKTDLFSVVFPTGHFR